MSDGFAIESRLLRPGQLSLQFERERRAEEEKEMERGVSEGDYA